MLTDRPSVCVASGDPVMSVFICDYTIAFTAARYYGQFVAQALIWAHRTMPHSTYAMMYLIWHRDAHNCLLDITNVTGTI